MKCNVDKMWRALLLLSVASVGYCQNCRGDERVRECENVCDKDGKNCTIRAALLLPKNTTYDANLLGVQSVMELAMKDKAVQDAFPTGVKFEWTAYDVTDCDAAYAVISAIDAYNDCAHVFFGPACDYGLAAVGRIAKFLGSSGTPLVTTGGFSFDFTREKKTCEHEFYMLVRSGPLGFKDIAYFLIDVFRHCGPSSTARSCVDLLSLEEGSRKLLKLVGHYPTKTLTFNWRQLFLITEAKGQMNVGGANTCYLAMQSFANSLKNQNITYTAWDTNSDGGRNSTENLKYYLAYRFGWQRCVLLYDTPSYEKYVGGDGGFLLASTIHNFMLIEGVNVFGKELMATQSHEDMLLQDVGNVYSSEFCLRCG